MPTAPKPKPPEGTSPGTITTKQMREMHALLRDHGITGDQAVHDYLSAWLDESGEPAIESRAELHATTAAKIIRALRTAAVAHAPGGLARALIAVQTELPWVAKTKTADMGNYSYTYADLADVTAAAFPLLTKHGLAFSCCPRITEKGGYEIVGVLLHDSGETREGALPLHGNDPQKLGGSITYMRRYLLGSMLGIVTDDDADARQAMGASQTRTWDGPSTADLLASIDADAARAGVTYEVATEKLRRDLGCGLDDLDTVDPWLVAPFAESVKAHADKVVAEREAAAEETPGPGAGGEQPPA